MNNIGLNLKSKTISILRWSEKYLKTDMVYVVKNGFWINLNQIISAVLALVVSILFAHYVSKEVYGVYKYIISMAGIGVAFSLTGMNTAVTRAVAQGFEGVFKESLKVQAKWSILQLLFSASISIYYFLNGNNVYGISFLIIGFLMPISSVANTFNSFLNGKKNFKLASIYSIWSTLIYFLGISASAIFMPNVVLLILAYYLTNTAANLFFCYKTIKKCDPNHLLRNEDINYGKHLSAMNFVSILATHLDSVIVYQFLGPVNLAIYSFAILIPEKIRTMFGFTSTIALPKISEKENSLNHDSIKRKIKLLALAGIIVAIVYAILAPLMFKIFFPQYLDTVIYSQVFSISLAVFAANISVSVLYAQSNKKSLYIFNVGGPIIKIIVTILAVYFYGLWGAIIAKIASHLLLTALSIILIKDNSTKQSAMNS
jgi:O-antigen/teichoic acid export membrane protein